MPDASNTKIIIINRALTHCKVEMIASLDENSQAARLANLFYDNCRTSVLRACDWRFATVKKPMVLLGSVEQALAYPNDQSKQDVLPKWNFTYVYPASCARVRKVFNAQSYVEVTPWNDRTITDRSNVITLFEIARSPITDQLSISCNLPNASVEFTKDITDESQFDSLFVDALAWDLAKEFCIPLTGDLELKRDIDADAKATMEEAKRKNGGEGVEMAPRQSNYENAREGYQPPY